MRKGGYSSPLPPRRLFLLLPLPPLPLLLPPPLPQLPQNLSTILNLLHQLPHLFQPLAIFRRRGGGVVAEGSGEAEEVREGEGTEDEGGGDEG
jgi:hypothetical protein